MREHQGNDFLFGPVLAYQYQHQGFLRLSAFGLMMISDDQYLKLDAGAKFTFLHKKLAVIPETGISCYLGDAAIIPYARCSLTPYTITPEVGISLYTIIDAGIGYGVNFAKKERFKPIKGFTVSVAINIPLNFNVY